MTINKKIIKKYNLQIEAISILDQCMRRCKKFGYDRELREKSRNWKLTIKGLNRYLSRLQKGITEPEIGDVIASNKNIVHYRAYKYQFMDYPEKQ